jgi:threonine/homoserine/homoserine lactone efflux protein
MVGLVASITLGPIGIMCIQRTLSKSRASGFASGLGDATVDTIFAALAYFFVSIISSAIESNIQIIKIVGGIFVIGVGMHYFLKNPLVQIRRNRAGKSRLWHDYASTFMLNLTNPAFVLWLLVVFSAFGVGSGDVDGGMPTPSMIAIGAQEILGFFAGATAWWFVLTFVVSLLRSRFRPRHLLWINRTAGTLITSLGVAAIISAFV